MSDDKKQIHFQICDHPQEWQRIREDVFIKEQGFHNEFDDVDERAIHICAYIGKQAIGCLRVYPDDSKKDCYHLGRVALEKAYRRQKIGSQLIIYAEDQLCSLNAKEVLLDAQCYLQRFYESLGYSVHGEVFYDEHVPHISMHKFLH